MLLSRPMQFRDNSVDRIVMSVHPVLIGGRWQAASMPIGSFQASNPATKAILPDDYPISSINDLDIALNNAAEAARVMQTIDSNLIADFLDRYATNIEARQDALVAAAHQETALPAETRLRSVELPRTTGQLRQAAAAVRDRSWCNALIDRKANIRSKYAALNGPVAVFGPNNFPYAFNAISGGDFAAAIAAGNPVIAKAHPAHPTTSRLLAEAAFEALLTTQLPPTLVQMVYHLAPEVGMQLVGDPRIAASAFTGSRAGGMKLKEAADKAGKLIYLEMSSINPVYFLPGALSERFDSLVADYAASCTLGAGQFCTNPGLALILASPQSEQFIEQVAIAFGAKPAGILFTESGVRNLAASVATWQAHGAQRLTGGAPDTSAGYGFQNTLYRVMGTDFLQNAAALQTEAFGTAGLVVVAADEAELLAITNRLDGNLTGAIYSAISGEDDVLYDKVAVALRPKIGRLLNDKMPTGVAVSPAMSHGGPYPATSHPGFTSVGIPASMLRFVALHSYDNVREYRLPAELRDKNPTGAMWRRVDGTWTQADL